VAVAGTLSPGASPGTMTVNGNVALAAGSNALFELTSAVSDQLLVSGNLTIASGATLTLTGNRPLTPGVTLDLIIANGGITGSFSTVNQAAGVGGFLSQSANRISLLGTFLTSSAFSPQVNRAITGVNNLLISGKANAAVLAGVPKLISNGAADAAAFARISPEPFAAATSLATEDGLSLIDATRSQARTSPTSTGLFSFAQGLGTRYRVRGSAGQGINSARLSSSGGFAGIGLGAEVASIGAFVGYGQSRQHIGALGSSLDGDGLMAGVQASASFAGFTINAVGAYSDRAVKLSRAAPQGGTQSHFHLRDTLGDLTASYSLPLAPAWSVKPRIGLSYIHVERGRVAETGSSPFTLQLASRKANNWFADAGLDLAGGAGPLRAFAGVALRQRLNSRQNDVDARFTGTDSAITALGATSDRTSVLGSAGASFSLTPRLSLSAGYTGAFSHTTRHTGTLGLRFAM
jgi:fibronectin-binding autotransporter adhesin